MRILKPDLAMRAVDVFVIIAAKQLSCFLNEFLVFGGIKDLKWIKIQNT
jgi:hypothetical protein